MRYDLEDENHELIKKFSFLNAAKEYATQKWKALNLMFDGDPNFGGYRNLYYR